MTARGPRQDATERAEASAASLLALPEEEREAWVRAVCAEALDVPEGDAARLPYAVVRDVVAPVLARRVRERDADAARWAAALMERWSGASCWDAALPGTSAHSLLRDAAAWRPDDPRVLEPLVERTARWFGHAMHELPAGVLYGADGATAVEAAEMLDELAAFDAWVRALGRAGEYRGRVAFWHDVVSAWAAYLADAPGASFEAYLDEHLPEWREARA